MTWTSITWASLATDVIAIITTLGGGGAIVSGLTAFFAKRHVDREMLERTAKLNRDLQAVKSDFTKEVERLKAELGQAAETHKLRLKKQELLFDREVAAAKAFIQLKRRLLPKRSHDDYDIYDAAEELGQSLHSVTSALRGFLDEYGAVLPKTIRDGITSASLRSEDGSFYSADFGEEQLFQIARRAADELIVNLADIEADILRLIRD